jgi:hypothetical protein
MHAKQCVFSHHSIELSKLGQPRDTHPNNEMRVFHPFDGAHYLRI